MRQAPSARAASGDSARPSIVSRRQIDESSVITLRAMCRNFGLPTTGNKADLRVRALKEFESRHVVEEQNQLPQVEVKPPNDSIVARASGDGRRVSKRLNVDNEENSGQVPHIPVHQHEQKQEEEEEEDDTGKQLTTSTIKPARAAKHLPVEATVAAKSDEPSVHAKSDAPEKDPVPTRHPAECSIANSPARPIARRLAEKFAQPTVSSTGIAASSPKSPRPPPLCPTPRNNNSLVPLTSQNRQQPPTESVDARGGSLDVAAIFQELAAGRRKLTQAEYETVLTSLRDKAPDRPPPVQIPINAAHVSLNALPNTPFLAFKPPPAKSLPGDKGMSFPQKTSTVPEGHVAGSSNKPHAVLMLNPKSPVADALEISDDNKRRIQVDESIEPLTGTAQRVQNIEPEAMEVDKPVAINVERSDSDDIREVPSVDNNDARAVEVKRTLQGDKDLPQTLSKVDSVSNENDKIIHSTTNTQPAVNVPRQVSLPKIFAGAEGGPHEGNIMNTRERQHSPSGKGSVRENGMHDEDLSPELEPVKNTQRPSEVKRSGFATPRELVRRFNRFGEGHSVLEDSYMKEVDNRDPATSLLRRNARRSSSGVPLFHSTRGPSTVGRSILKTRTASKARESQNRLRRTDGVHKLSGRSSFRVKRPVSASAGALLVDLRRVSGSQRPSSERLGQRGSYQAEIARRPPPMPASALKILKELEQIQGSNSTPASRKRDVSPPPLPPSVVKRARRSGHFSKAVPSSGEGLSIFEQAGPGTQSNYPGATPSRAEPKELISTVGRRMPKIPVVAYGAGRKRNKRSRIGTGSDTIPALNTREEKNLVNHDVAVREDDVRESLSPPRTRKRSSQGENLTFGDNTTRHRTNQSVDAPAQEAPLSFLSKSKAESDRAPSAPAAVERRDNAFPVLKKSFSGKKLAQPLSGEGPSNMAFGTAAQETNAEIFKATNPSETIAHNRNENEHAAEPIQSFSGRSTLNEPLPKKPPLLPPFGTAKQPAQQPKGLLKSQGASLPIETREKEAKPAQVEGTKNILWPSTGVTLTGTDSLAFPVRESTQALLKQTDKPTRASQQTPTNVNAFQSDIALQLGNNSAPAPGFLTNAPPRDSPSVASAFPVSTTTTPLHSERKDENAVSNEPAGLHQTTSPFGSFTGTKSAVGIFSVPSKQDSQGDNTAPSPFGVPSQQSPMAELEEKQKQPPLLGEDGTDGDRSETLKSSPPMGVTTSLRAGDFKGGDAVEEGPKTASGSENLPETVPNAATVPLVDPTFGVPQDKATGLSSVGEAAPPNVANPSVGSKPLMTPLASADLAPSTIPSTVAPNSEKPEVSNDTKDDAPGTRSNASPGLFSSGPFSEPNKPSTFSFPSASRIAEGSQLGPFSESKFNSAFSSVNPSNMFAFGSSTEKGSTVKPAPSFSGLPDSATQDKEKLNPFTQITNPTPFAFGTQTPSGSGEGTGGAGPGFGLSSGSGAGTMFGQSNGSTAAAFGSSFGTAPSIFNTGGSNSFPAGSAAPAFGAPAQSSTAPLFGNVAIPSTPFGLPSEPAGATGTNQAAPSMFGSAPAGTSAPAFGGGSVGSFSFPNSNAGTFGASSTQQQNPFNQGGNAAPMASGGAFTAAGSGGFNMGSATRGPPAPRRRLRGRRTLR